MVTQNGELRRNAERKVFLEETLVELAQQQKELEKDVFQLKISAHNEQADVENLESFSMKGFFLGLTGKKEERLEQERREARNAQVSYETAAARLEMVSAQMEQSRQELAALGNCDDEYRRFVMKALEGKNQTAAIQEQAEKVDGLVKTRKEIQEARELTDSLTKKLNQISNWSGVRVAAGGTPGVASADDGLRSAERNAQEILIALQTALGKIRDRVLAMDVDGLLEFPNDYLLELYAEAIISSRVSKVFVQLRSAVWQLEAALPKVEEAIMEQGIALQKTVLELGKML